MSSEKDDNRSNKGFQSLSGSLSDLTKKILGKNGFVEIDIITNWDKIAGKETARYVQPQSIDFKKGKREGGILVLSVCSGAFATEVMHKKNIIIEKVNTNSPSISIPDILIDDDFVNLIVSSEKFKNTKIYISDVIGNQLTQEQIDKIKEER